MKTWRLRDLLRLPAFQDLETQMRDPARIPRILEAIRIEWEKSPDLRLGQLLVNAMPGDTDRDIVTDLFGMEDARIVEEVRGLQLGGRAEGLGLYGDPSKQPKG